MKKFLQRELCLIVSGALLALQSSNTLEARPSIYERAG